MENQGMDKKEFNATHQLFEKISHLKKNAVAPIWPRAYDQVLL